jgi:dolichol-phosphate mannosyltransferase
MRQLTVVIPTFNEAENLENITQALYEQPLGELRILVIDDNSPDGTGKLAENLASRFRDRFEVIHREGKLGLGSAYIQGFQHALSQGAEAIGQMDADFSHSPAYLPEMLAGLDENDAIFGSRYVPGGGLDEHWGRGRLLLSWFGNAYARTILRLRIRDATGGFRIWRRQTLSALPLTRVRSNGYVFQVEMAYVAQRLGFEIRELPIYFEDRRIGQSKMSFRIQVEAATRVWLLPFIYRGLKPG